MTLVPMYLNYINIVCTYAIATKNILQCITKKKLFVYKSSMNYEDIHVGTNMHVSR